MTSVNHKRRRQLAALGLAATMAAPLVVLGRDAAPHAAAPASPATSDVPVNDAAGAVDVSQSLAAADAGQTSISSVLAALAQADAQGADAISAAAQVSAAAPLSN